MAQKIVVGTGPNDKIRARCPDEDLWKLYCHNLLRMKSGRAEVGKDDSRERMDRFYDELKCREGAK